MKKSALTSSMMFAAVLAFAAGGVYAQRRGTAPPPNGLSVEPGRVVLTRYHTTLLLQPYAPNIIRVSISRLKPYALAAPGYGISAKPNAHGWKFAPGSGGGTYRSSRLAVSILGFPRHFSPHLLHQRRINQYFSSTGGPGYAPVRLRFQLPNGHTVVNLENWFMYRPSNGSGNTEILQDRRPSDPPFYQVGATFSTRHGEQYYGLGENQQGRLDHRDQQVQCWSNYGAAGGESFCVPFLVTNKGYAVLWDNPSKTTVDPHFNNQTKWVSQVGQRVSFFLIVGKTPVKLYEGYRLLSGAAPLLPIGAYGFIQSKERYATQKEILHVAHGYRKRHLPADYVVVDFFWYPKMGQFSFLKKDWPDPAAMNAELHRLGFHSMISVWPRFAVNSPNYRMLKKKGWFYHLADGQPTQTSNWPGNKTGSNLDLTNPAAARWFWRKIHATIINRGFDSIWTDETEPDIPPNGSYYHIGPGTEFFNVYPLFETSDVYQGLRRDLKERPLILARAGYIGAQRNATIFWSSDISPTWDTLRRQVPAGLGVTASGLPYWTDDVGGFWSLPAVSRPVHPPLLSDAGARANVGGDIDYPELYVRWFEYGVFMPILRTHGMRRHNTIWSYGRQATPILEKYLRLRYALIPYIYSCAYRTYKTGAPYMRALFMDFPRDPKVDRLNHEYMFGPDFLVAPVTRQGQTRRKVYLPAGADWYDYWTNREYHGGQTVVVNAPISIIPLFVRAGSILPIGKPVEDMDQPQALQQIRIYPGASARFDLYRDSGWNNRYLKSGGRITVLRWNDQTRRFTHSGARAWTGPASRLIKVIHPSAQ